MTLHALGQKIGHFAFFPAHARLGGAERYGNVTTPQFIALAEQVSGIDLDHFLDVWLPGRRTRRLGRRGATVLARR